MIEQFKAGEELVHKQNPARRIKFIGMDGERLVVKILGPDGYVTFKQSVLEGAYELPKKGMYVNLYADVSEPNAVSGSSYATKEKAIARRRNCAVNFIGTFKLEKL